MNDTQLPTNEQTISVSGQTLECADLSRRLHRVYKIALQRAKVIETEQLNHQEKHSSKSQTAGQELKND